MAVSINGTTGVTTPSLTSTTSLTFPVGGIETADLADSAVTTLKIAEGAVNEDHIHTTLDLTGKTITLPSVTGGLAINTTLSGIVPNALEYGRVGRRYLAAGNMSGATWVNTGITFTPNAFAYVLVDAIGNENGRNNGFRRYVMTYNAYTGWATSAAIIAHQQDNNYGQVDAIYQNGRVEVKATNGVSSGTWRIYATEYVW